MSSDVKPITVTILDKEYIVGCVEDEREALFASVEFLNNKMQ
ncbi:MAG: cell division protein ZapA (FtsZ GTPase activity inhibitor), partial [Gammaproteobacteria bacterium]